MALNSIQGFIQKAGYQDFARNNLFRVTAVDIAGILQLNEAELLYCQGGKIPSRTNPVGTVQYMGMELPYSASTVKYEGNQDYALTFFVDAGSNIARAFEAASRAIFDDKTSSGNWRFPRVEDHISVAALDFDLNPFEQIKFCGVAFHGFDAIDFQTAKGDGTAIEITCHFSYLYYERELING